MDTKHNSQSNKKLDAEFRRILRIIKPYIPCIMNNQYLTSYRLWLEKLSDVDVSEKEERNKYIIELCYQIQDGILEYPFTQLPRNGLLPPFKNDCINNQQCFELISSSNSLSSSRTAPKAHNNDSNYIREMSNMEIVKSRCTTTKISNNGDASGVNNSNIVNQCDAPHKKRTPHTISKPPNTQFPQEFHNLMEAYMSSANKSNPPRHYNHQAVTNIGNNYLRRPPTQMIPAGRLQSKNRELDDSGSWCDMTDITTSTPSKAESYYSDALPTLHHPLNKIINPQEMYENKIAELMKIITDLQKQNIRLNEDVVGYERDITIRNTTVETSIHNLLGEVNSLKSRLQEFKDIKAALRNNQAAAATQWEGTVNSLTNELEVVQQQNTLLRDELSTLEKKLEDIEKLKQAHAKEITEIENKFNQKLDDLKNEYESKILDVKANYEKTVQSKDGEIQRLENLIEVQCRRMHEEVTKIRTQMDESQLENSNANSDKIVFLQKCIAKMDKLFKKSERSYSKQIAKLKTEIEMRDKIIHIQLSTQRAELVANSNAERKIEIDSTVGELEERYRRLLETQQCYFLSEKKQDSVLISELRAIIAQHNIDYNS